MQPDVIQPAPAAVEPKAAASRPLLVALVVAWACAAAAGTAALMAYETRPGAVGHVGGDWPSASRLGRLPGRHTLVVTMNPRCACSVATLREVEQILSRARGPVDAVVLMSGPDAEGADLWRRAAAVPGVRVVADADGREARLFGAETSGHVVLYDAAGRMRFAGGVTPSRGHVGDNAGRDAVLAALGGNGGDQRTTPSAAVYGCPVLPSSPAGAP